LRRLTLYLILFPFFISGQGNLYFSPVYDVSEVLEGLRSISQNDLRTHLTFLASNAAEGRETGEHGLQVAAEYIASQFRRVGLTSLNQNGSFFQRYEILKTRLGDDPTLALLYEEGNSQVRETFQYKEDYFLSTRGLIGGLEVQSHVIFTGYGITAPEYDYDDYADTEVSHKIMLVIEGEPDFSDTERFKGDKKTHYSDVREKLKIAKEHQAAALLVASNPRSDEIFSEKMKPWERWLRHESMTLPTSEKAVPLFFINSRTADRILAGTGNSLHEIQMDIESSGKPLSQNLSDRYIRFTLDVQKESLVTQNVAGYFPGNDPNKGHETIIVSAHYDHLGKNENGTIWYGADDNGSGTSVMLEVAEAVSTNPELPERGFIFLAVSGEEKGLLGSQYYINHPLIPLDNTVTDLNIDMVGRNAPDSVYIIGSNMISEDLHEINEFAATKINHLELDYRYNTLDDPNRFYYRSDHYNFAKRDIPVIFYFAGIHEDYHKPSDTVDKINFAKMEKVARLVFLTGWGVAKNETRPRKNAGQYPELPDQIKF